MTTFLKVTNNAVSTLAADINSSVTNLAVASGDGALFPSTYPFHISIGAEILSCTNRSTDTLTVVRAQQGTSAAAHSEGDAVGLNWTAKHLDDITNRFALVEKDAPYTATTSDNKILVDATGRSITISLPAAGDNSDLEYIIKKIDASSHSVVIDGNGSETIDGEKTIELQLQYAYVTIVCDGDEWHIIGGEYVKMEDILIRLVDEQESQLSVLNRIEEHLAEITDLEIKEEDTNDSD